MSERQLVFVAIVVTEFGDPHPHVFASASDAWAWRERIAEENWEMAFLDRKKGDDWVGDYFRDMNISFDVIDRFVIPEGGSPE